ncbi:MAG: LPS export ABC transporter ATP-binding protein [Candidatus Hydrogenedentes bacterium]|nr:LPS export ABC transporter ATP-binding protein [Candidatus Hydrogenedentota bacterium]
MALEARDLTKSFHRREVVSNVSLEVRRGEIVGLLGRNGAGKTTTFKMVVGLLRPERGRIHLNGRDITKLPMYMRAREGIAYLPQEPSVFQKLTVEQNLLAVLEMMGVGKRQQRERAAELMAELGISHLAKQKAFTLSGGERRRTEICRALVRSPSFLLLDEPFTGVDPIAVADVQQVIVPLKEKGLGVLVTDHNVRETLKITDHAYIIDRGKVICSGTPETIASDRRVREVYLGADFEM